MLKTGDLARDSPEIFSILRKKITNEIEEGFTRPIRLAVRRQPGGLLPVCRRFTNNLNALLEPDERIISVFMESIRVDVSYRPLRIAWAIRAGDIEGFRSAVRIS